MPSASRFALPAASWLKPRQSAFSANSRRRGPSPQMTSESVAAALIMDLDDHLGAARHALQFVGLGDDEALPRLQVQSDPHNDLGEGAEAGLKVSYHNCFVSF
jgi:hypothetical protein